jgi:hypothetical protein
MEVHHHPHVEKKKFKEYFFEFLMIFLAVTLGFFAESLREHISEKDKSEVFARSLYADFKSDTASLHQLITFSESKIRLVDSLEYLIHLPRGRFNDSTLYVGVLFLASTFQFNNINGTYEQIKNSGSLRFFDQSLINLMNSYDATSSTLKLMEDWENKVLFEQVLPQASRMFNFGVFNDIRANKFIKHEMYFKKMDDESVDILLNQGRTVSRLRQRQLNQHKLLLQKANEIIDDLKKEYHLENL